MQGPRVETFSFNPVHGSLIHGLMAFVDTSVCFFLFCFGPSHPSFQPTEMISGFDQRSVGIMGYVFPVFYPTDGFYCGVISQSTCSGDP